MDLTGSTPPLNPDPSLQTSGLPPEQENIHPRIRALDEVRAADAQIFGGKAVGLARLIQAGARVPPGFAIEAGTLSPACWPESVRAAFRSRIETLLAGGTLAMRSSAPVEDASARSYAGLFETVLGVSSAENALAAAARCIDSGTSERVRAYAGIVAAQPVGLVAQIQVVPRAAGVCFTVDPLGRDRAILVETVAGSGDALVSGRIRPQAWRVYRAGTGKWEVLGGREASVLGPSEAIEIATEAARLVTHFGHPLDLEWALDERGTLFWLQARPITEAIAPPELRVDRVAPEADDGPVTVWANWNVRETLPSPFPPLAWDIWREQILPRAMEPLVACPRRSPLFRQLIGVDLVQGRLYWNMNALLGTSFGIPVFRRNMHAMDARAAEVIDRLEAEGVIHPRRIPISRRRLELDLFRRLLRFSTRGLGAIRPARFLRALDECAAKIAARPPVGQLPDSALIDEMAIYESPELEPLHSAMSGLVLSIVVWSMAQRAFRDHPQALGLLTAGIEGTPTTGISLAIDGLVEAARSVPEAFQEDGDFLARLEDFLKRYGHRCPGEFDLMSTRWREDPRMIIDLVRAGLKSPPEMRVPARLKHQRELRRTAVEAAVRGSSRWRRPWLRFMARQVERHMPMREAPKHYAMVEFARIREAILEAGKRLVTRGDLLAQEDAFFLRWLELCEALKGQPVTNELRALVAERRNRYAQDCSMRPPDFIRSDGVPVDDEAELQRPADGVLRGQGVSVGNATGVVKVLHAPDPSLLGNGSVLVVAFADPGWTPLFPLAAAVVMEVGGSLCHAAIVARELGVPAVFGVRDATSILADGQRVTVDGSTGTVSPAR